MIPVLQRRDLEREINNLPNIREFMLAELGFESSSFEFQSSCFSLCNCHGKVVKNRNTPLHNHKGIASVTDTYLICNRL